MSHASEVPATSRPIWSIDWFLARVGQVCDISPNANTKELLVFVFPWYKTVLIVVRQCYGRYFRWNVLCRSGTTEAIDNN